MPKMIAVIIETVVLVCALWLLSFMAIFMHELGHALGYMLSTLNRHWHIRVGSGKRLLKTKRLTVKLLVFDGEFIVAGNTVDSKAKLISTLSGGPILSFISVAVLLLLRFGGMALDSDIILSSAIEYFINYALISNIFYISYIRSAVSLFLGRDKGRGERRIKADQHNKKQADLRLDNKTSGLRCCSGAAYVCYALFIRP